MADTIEDLLKLPKDAPLEARRLFKQRLVEQSSAGRVALSAELAVDEQGRIEAYAAEFRKFNRHNDFNLPGCFARSITERHLAPINAGQATRLKVTWMHREPFALPVEAKEDERGLRTVSQVIDHKGGGAYRYELIRQGVVDGVSIEFDSILSEMRWMRGDEYEIEDLGTPDDFWFGPREMRHLHLFGWGFVDHPSADDARVEAVRHAREIRRDMDRFMIAVGQTPERPAPEPQPEAAADPASETDSNTTEGDRQAPALTTEQAQAIKDALAKL